jgi:hypothetical protein
MQPLGRLLLLVLSLVVIVVFLAEGVSAAPPPPSLLFPENDKRFSFAENTLRLGWTRVENGENYRVHISDDPSFPYDNYTSPWIADNYWELDLRNFVPGVRYYWRVQARDNQGVEGENSEAWCFRRNSPPRLSNLLVEGRPSPADKIPIPAPTFSWNFTDPDGDTQKGVAIQVGSSENACDKWNFRSENVAENRCLYIGAPLERGYWFYVRITAIDSFGDQAPWEYGVWGRLKLNQPPQATDLRVNGEVNPTNISVLRSFTWNFYDGDLDNQSHYRIKVGTTPGENDIWDSGEVASPNHSAEFPENLRNRLQPGSTYFVEMTVKDGLEWMKDNEGREVWAEGRFRMNSPPVLEKVEINGGAKYTNSRTVTLTVTATDDNMVVNLLTSFDGEHWDSWPYYTPLTLTLPGGDGVKQVYVMVVDDKACKSNLVSRFIVLDETPPRGLAGIQPPDGAVVGPDVVRISWNVPYDDTSGVVSLYVLRLSRDNFSTVLLEVPCEKNYYDLPYENQTGTYYWKVTAFDKAGNEENTPVYRFTYSLDAPVVRIRTDREVVNSSDVLLRLSGSNLAYYRYAFSEADLYRAPWASYGGGVENIRLRLGEGDHRICFEVKSPAGVTAGPIVVPLLVDLSPPQVSLAADKLFSTSKTRTLFIEVKDRWSGVSEMRLKVGDNWGSWENFENQRIVELPKGGLNSVEVQVRDRAGNESVVAKLELYYSTGPPKPDIQVPQTVTQPTCTLTIHALPEVSLYVNDEKIEPMGGVWMVNLYLREGRNEFVIRTEDPSGQSWENTYEVFYLRQRGKGFPLWSLALLPLAGVIGVYLYARWSARKRRMMEMRLAARPAPAFRPQPQTEKEVLEALDRLARRKKGG